MILLDTDTIIYFLKGEQAVVKRLERALNLGIATTIINHSELLFGAYHSQRKEDNLKTIHSFLGKIPIIPYCSQSSNRYAQTKAHLKQEGNLIADLDLMIGCIALHHNATLVTNNLKHFSKIDDLVIETWRGEVD